VSTCLTIHFDLELVCGGIQSVGYRQTEHLFLRTGVSKDQISKERE
jgi:hypothetical protein